MEHWKHLRTTNVIESPFATVRLRERATRGAKVRAKGLLMAFKLLDMVQLRWRRLDGAQLLPLVRAGVKFVDGVAPEEPAQSITQLTGSQSQESRLIMPGRSTTFDNYSRRPSQERCADLADSQHHVVITAEQRTAETSSAVD